jgi:hypothetical protein
MVKFRKAYIANPVGRFDNKLEELADEVVSVCPTPLYDAIAEDDEMAMGFKIKIAKTLDDFDSTRDVIMDYGDPLIFAMMIYYLADNDRITVGRYNRKFERYVFHTINEWWTDKDEVNSDENSSRH